MEELTQLTQKITSLDSCAMQQMQEKLLQLAKPPGSLGKLESMNIQCSGIYGSVEYDLKKRAVLIFCADNGVEAEGVSSAPQSITLAQALNFTRRKSGVGVLAEVGECETIIIDVGINAEVHHPLILDRKIRKSTENIANTRALTRMEVLQAIEVGADIVKTMVDEGYQLFGVGEMGIANTTTSSALLCLLSGETVENVTGKGGGLTESAFHKKLWVIKKAIAREVNRNDVLDCLGSVGGLDLCAMTGAYLQAAASHKLIVIDGFISAVSALCAYRLAPLSVQYFMASHASYERGYQVVMKELQLEASLNLDMRLGEGSGCPIAFKLLDFASAILKMAKLDEINDDPYAKDFKELEF